MECSVSPPKPMTAQATWTSTRTRSSWTLPLAKSTRGRTASSASRDDDGAGDLVVERLAHGLVPQRPERVDEDEHHADAPQEEGHELHRVPGGALADPDRLPVVGPDDLDPEGHLAQRLAPPVEDGE